VYINKLWLIIYGGVTMEKWQLLIKQAMELIDIAMDDEAMDDEVYKKVNSIHTELSYIIED
jgi:division protein CdvB (Snf7/Vps24/ESCRT-III family)